ncbi:hypothetical protein 2210_scaffold709_00031 [Bacteriophage sp.]|nr:hypothetical protein 2210_scaffold709_00031 [Bacteriophage sp.]
MRRCWSGSCFSRCGNVPRRTRRRFHLTFLRWKGYP